MPRDTALEQTLRHDLRDEQGLTEKPMFGGLAVLLNGHLLCGARQDGLMVRLGKGRDGWALATPGVTSLRSSGRQMPGWVRVSRELCADEATRQRFLEAALEFTRGLPAR